MDTQKLANAVSIDSSLHAFVLILMLTISGKRLDNIVGDINVCYHNEIQINSHFQSTCVGDIYLSSSDSTLRAG